VISNLKQMPPNFISNTEKDFSILDRKIDMFRLKQEMVDISGDKGYRKPNYTRFGGMHRITP